MANNLLEHALLGPLQGVAVADRLTQFRSIPYGSIKQRFARSEVLTDVPRGKNLARPTRKEIYDATKQGPQSIQPLKSAHMDAKSNQLPEDVIEQEQAENCLRLTITAPSDATSQSRLPVLIFIHGGAFFIGSGERKYYEPLTLCTQALNMQKPLIFVSVNYRLGALGFFHSPDAEGLMPPNNGLHDQLTAFNWLRTNIGGFGGDKDNITAIGQSAGGESLSLHNLSGKKDPLYRRSIMFSGTPLTMPDKTPAEHQENFIAQAKKLGIDTKKVSSRQIAQKMIDCDVSKLRDLSYVGQPCVDTAIIPHKDHATQRDISAGKIMQVGWLESQIISSCSYDGSISNIMMRGDGKRRDHAKSFIKIADEVLENPKKLLQIYDIQETTPDEKALEKICQFESDIGFLAPALAMVKGTADKTTTYFELFDLGNPFPGPLEEKRFASHTWDIVALLGAYEDRLPNEYAEKIKEWRARYINYIVEGEAPWKNFEKNGKSAMYIVPNDGPSKESELKAVLKGRLERLLDLAEEEGLDGADTLWSAALSPQCPPQAQNYASQMIASNIARAQGASASVSGTGLIELGIFYQALRQGIAATNNTAQKQEWTAYLHNSTASAVPLFTNATTSAQYPLDRFSIGTEMIRQSWERNDDALNFAIQVLQDSLVQQPRNANGGLWYYDNVNNLSAYQNLSYTDGMYSYPTFAILSSCNSTNDPELFGAAAALKQLEVLEAICDDGTGLLVHGYDALKTHPWADSGTGASPSVWGRSLAWYTLGLVEAIDALPSASSSNTRLETKLARGDMMVLLKDLIRAQLIALERGLAINGRYSVWQVVDLPGASINNTRNFVESSASLMTAYSLLRSVRLGFLEDTKLRTKAITAAIGLWNHIFETQITGDTNGTLNLSGTSSIASLSPRNVNAEAGLLLGFDASLASPKLDLEVYRKIINIVISDVVLYLCASIALKLSLAFFFLRFVIERWQRILIWIFLAMFIADSVSSIFLVLFWCSDPTEYATKTLMGQCSGTSTALNAANILQGVLNAATDWLFATLPIFVVMRTTLSKREKAIVAFIFALAVAGSIAAILRAVYWPALTKGSLSGFRRGMTWCTVEIGAGIIASSAATLRPLLKKMDLGERWSRNGNGRDGSDGNSEPKHSEAVEKTITLSDSIDTGTKTSSGVIRAWWDTESVSPDLEGATFVDAMQSKDVRTAK
ncbi:alpha/beta-hydrolase [Aureobasidium subglaciale]|nr:alpha/beta-hydrolase [Aureobasidium subglaciale]